MREFIKENKKRVMATFFEIITLIIVALLAEIVLRNRNSREYVLLMLLFEVIGIILCRLIEEVAMHVMFGYRFSRSWQIIVCCLLVVIFTSIFFVAEALPVIITNAPGPVWLAVIPAFVMTVMHLDMSDHFDRIIADYYLSTLFVFRNNLDLSGDEDDDEDEYDEEDTYDE